MEQHGTASSQNPDALLGIAEKYGEVSAVPEERAQSRSPGRAGVLWCQRMLPGSWGGSKRGQATGGLQGDVPLSAHTGQRTASKWEESCRGVRGWAAEGIGVPECLSVPVFLALAQMGTWRRR